MTPTFMVPSAANNDPGRHATKKLVSATNDTTHNLFLMFSSLVELPGFGVSVLSSSKFAKQAHPKSSRVTRYAGSTMRSRTSIRRAESSFSMPRDLAIVK